jgi:hypothetical protein
MRAERYKALLLVGCPGSGKDILLRTIFKESDVLEINLNQLYSCIQNGAKYPYVKKINEGAPIVVNGSARRDGKIELVGKVLEQMGYETELCIVTTTNDVSKSRNDARISSGAKTISECIRQSKWNESYEYARLNENLAMLFDNSQDAESMTPKLQRLKLWVSSFFETHVPTLDEAVTGFLDENLKNAYDSHKALELSVEPKTTSGMSAYHAYNAKKVQPTYRKGPKVTIPNKPVIVKPIREAKDLKRKSEAANAPENEVHPEGSEGAMIATEAKNSFKTFRKQAKAPTNVQYVGDPQGVGGATADLREEKKKNKNGKQANPPSINADARVGDDQAASTLFGMVGEHVCHYVKGICSCGALQRPNPRTLSLRKLREEILVKSPDVEFIELEVYEDIGIDGEKVIFEGRAITTNKPFRRGDNYSVYVKTETSVERLDFRNHKRVLQEISDVLIGRQL